MSIHLKLVFIFSLPLSFLPSTAAGLLVNVIRPQYIPPMFGHVFLPNRQLGSIRVAGASLVRRKAHAF